MSDHEHEMIDRRLEDAIAAGCEQSRLLLTRRAMLGVSTGLFSWACLPRHAEAFDGDRRLLIVSLIGGMDGLHVAYPLQERNTLRGYRASMLAGRGGYLERYRALGRSGFVINSNLEKFAAMFGRGEAALVHAVAPPLQTRSHFDCMDNLQNGQPGFGNPTRDGWLNRFLSRLAENQPARRGLSATGSPLILQGEAPVQSWSGSELTGLAGFADALLPAYRQSGLPLFSGNHGVARQLELGLATHSLATTSESGQSAGDSSLTRSFRGTARLMKAATGPRIAVLSVDGLDTHDGQVGRLDAKLAELDNGLDAFRTELGSDIWARTVVVCVTEFGRTARSNVIGTDHGTGTVALLLGGNVNGGRVIADWPGIATLNDDRDLTATIDIRSLFKGILSEHLGLWKYDTLMNTVIFPDSHAIRPMEGITRLPKPNRLRLRNNRLT
jgi:uncharacterized protein (DUF1501 family)